MRIVYLLSPHLRSGTLKQIGMLTHGLRQSFDIHACSLSSEIPARQRLPRFGGRLTYCPYRYGDPTFLWRLSRIIRLLRPQVIHTWGNEANRIGGLTKLPPFRSPNCSVIGSVRNWEQVPRSRWGAWLIGLLDRIIVNRVELQDGLAKLGYPRDKILSIPNGVWNEHASQVRTSLRGELNLATDVRLIGVVGDLTRDQRTTDLIWATDLLRAIHPEVHLVVIGDGPEKARLRQFAHQTNSPAAIHFLGHRTDVMELLPQLTCLWNSEISGGCSNAILEAQRAQIPIFASDTGPHRALMRGSHAGFLIPLGDTAEFARRTHLWFETSPNVATIDNSTPRDVINEFPARENPGADYEVSLMVARYRDLYESLLTARQSIGRQRLPDEERLAEPA